MKKQNEQKTETTVQKSEKPVKKGKLFFLYADGRGFIHTDPQTGAPSFTAGEIVKFTSLSKAKTACEFIMRFKIASDVHVFTKVA